MLTWEFKTTFAKSPHKKLSAIGREEKQVLYMAELLHVISKGNFSRIRGVGSVTIIKRSNEKDVHNETCAQ